MIVGGSPGLANKRQWPSTPECVLQTESGLLTTAYPESGLLSKAAQGEHEIERQTEVLDCHALAATFGICRQRFGTTNALKKRFGRIDVGPQFLTEGLDASDKLSPAA